MVSVLLSVARATTFKKLLLYFLKFQPDKRLIKIDLWEFGASIEVFSLFHGLVVVKTLDSPTVLFEAEEEYQPRTFEFNIDIILHYLEEVNVTESITLLIRDGRYQIILESNYSSPRRFEWSTCNEVQFRGAMETWNTLPRVSMNPGEFLAIIGYFLNQEPSIRKMFLSSTTSTPFRSSFSLNNVVEDDPDVVHEDEDDDLPEDQFLEDLDALEDDDLPEDQFLDDIEVLEDPDVVHVDEEDEFDEIQVANDDDGFQEEGFLEDLEVFEDPDVAVEDDEDAPEDGIVDPDDITEGNPRCSNMEELKQIHAQVLKRGYAFDDDTFPVRKLLAFCSSASDSGSLAYTHKVFDGIGSPNTFTWSTIIRGYAQSTQPEQALFLYRRMLADSVPQTLTLFRSCSKLVSVCHHHPRKKTNKFMPKL
ncbi:hypothetical protein Ddye_010227 [Dipteronia dyeriana]|uniref:Pentatricopeptide repeat-containing protein n=1 Tax=Dipteronia dyeriana TaxID=168575 RepID=A0AAE0CMY7_9ROSI|nr:hypothetical protein Ddye_010227 [Dipteronia dyeriana]